MNTQCTFYLCPICFSANETPRECHGQPMVEYNACLQTAEQRKPLLDEQGRLTSRAPRWFLEARRTQ